MFAVSIASVKSFVRCKQEISSSDAFPHAGDQPLSLNEQQEDFVRDTIKETKNLTLQELRQRLKQKYKKGSLCPHSAACSSNRGGREKKSLYASKRATGRVQRMRTAYQQAVLHHSHCRIMV